MSQLSMSREQREAFLADVHVGVLAVAQPDGPPALTPVWYRYREGVVQVVTTA
jgi:nitroimidazol reductase NimA-like FMN-containing flavoprotein (pyridoxamine 5'-phosphate oxidase superfamily)